jgi:hypothetical protein
MQATSTRRSNKNPPFYAQPVWIYWTAEVADLTDLHTKDVSEIDIDFYWGADFPKEEVLPYLEPYKKEEKNQQGLHFDIGYYHNAFPDIYCKVVFSKAPEAEEVKIINNCLTNFVTT